MPLDEITRKVKALKEELSGGNSFGEKVTVVAAIKTQTVEAINAAIQAGVDAVAENKAQEFRDKNEFLLPCPRHFIGHLQTNKVKYLIGKVALYHSCDRYAGRIGFAPARSKNARSVRLGENARRGDRLSFYGYER